MLEAFTRWRIARPLRESRSQGLLARVGAPTLAGTGDPDPWSPGPRWPRLSVTGGHTPAQIRSRRGVARVCPDPAADTARAGPTRRRVRWYPPARARCRSRAPAMYL